MKALSTAVQALLATRQFFACDLIAIALVGGGNLYYAAGDCDIRDPVSGLTYACGGMTGPYFGLASNGAAKVHQKLGTDVDTLTLDVLPGTAAVLGLPFVQAVRQGVFDGAVLQMLRAYAPFPPVAASWPIPVTGTVVQFTGFIAEVDAGDGSCTMIVNSPMERLQAKLPRNLYQPGCNNVLGGAGCGVPLGAYAVAGNAAAGSTAGVITVTGLSQAAGYFDLGTLTFGSGANAGLSRSVRAWTQGSPLPGGGFAVGTLALMVPFPAAPAAGDSFTLVPGCDGTMDTQGCPKFSNLANYRGFPFVPAPTTAGA